MSSPDQAAAGPEGGRAAREAVRDTALEHPQPIPPAVWVRDVLHSSPIGPRRIDGSIPEGVDEQLRVTFENLARLLEAAGAARDGVAFVGVQLSDRSHREVLNAHWTRFFSDPAPARQVTEVSLPVGVDVLLTVIAYR